MKTPKTHSGDANLAINAAKSFFSLAGTFFQAIPAEPVAKMAYLKEHKGMLIAATTNLAFSVELFLKAVAIKTRGRAKDGHKLIDRFKDLPADVQASIERCYRYRIQHDAHQKFDVIEFGVSPADREPAEAERTARRLNHAAGVDVCSLLEAENDAFQIWRYFHEQAQNNDPVCVRVHWYRMGVLVHAIQDQLILPDKKLPLAHHLATAAKVACNNQGN